MAVGLNHSPADIRKRRQDLDAEYLEAGSVYGMDAQTFRVERTRFCGRTAIAEIPAAHVFEIDEPADLDRAHAIAPLHVPAAENIEWGNIAAIAFDFDGVFTDNTVLVDETDRESVRVSRADGMGIALLRELGISMTVISSESNPVVEARCRKLRLPVVQGVEEKGVAVRNWIESQGISRDRVTFIGNDENDIPAFEAVRWAIGPSDAQSSVRPLVHALLPPLGGHGVLREMASRIANARVLSRDNRP